MGYGHTASGTAEEQNVGGIHLMHLRLALQLGGTHTTHPKGHRHSHQDYLITIQYTKYFNIPYFIFSKIIHLYFPCTKFQMGQINLSQIPIKISIFNIYLVICNRGGAQLEDFFEIQKFFSLGGAQLDGGHKKIEYGINIKIIKYQFYLIS